MNPGTLRHYVEFQNETTTTDANYNEVSASTWTTFASRWCSITPASAAEFTRNQQIQADATHVFRCRGEELTAFTNKSRIVYGSRTWQIVSVLRSEERDIMLEIQAKEVL